MFPPDDTQYQHSLVALLRAERHIEHAVLDILDDWLETTRYVILHEVGQAFGLTAAGYTDPSAAVDAATLAYDTWRRSLNNRLIPQVGIAFGEAYRQIRHGHAPQRYEVAYLESVSDRLRAWPDGAFEQIRPALVEAVTDGEDYDQIRDRIGQILGIDSRTRDLRARITEIEALLTDDDADLDPAERKELAAERRALWREHDDSLGEWRWKARRIARTEAHAATEAAKIKAAQDAAYESGQTVFKRWRSTRDLRVRASHRVADGQVVRLADPFRVGAALLQFPGDPAALAPQEVINCRCVSAVWSGDMLQDGLQGPDGSIGEVKPGGVRLGPDEPDAMEKAIDEAADELGQPRPQHPDPADRPRAELPAPIELTDERSEPLPDLSAVSDDDLVDLLEQAHDARDDDLYEWADAEWERRQTELRDSDVDTSQEPTWLQQVEKAEPEEAVNAVRAVNPHYSDSPTYDPPEYQANCQRVVQAYELRRRGYPVQAQPNRIAAGDDQLNYGPGTFTSLWHERDDGERHFERVGGEKHNPKMKEVAAKVAAWGANTRGWVQLKFKKGFAHIFVYEVDAQGRVAFMDPQSGTASVPNYFQRARAGTILVMRTDDLIPTDDVQAFVFADEKDRNQ